MLKITKGIEPIHVNTIITCVYAQPGIGRTTLGYSAEAPLLLDFDQAAHRAKNRGDTVLINSWADVEKMDASDFAPYKTVVIDTVGRALDHMTVKIIAGNAKCSNNAGGLSLQGYGVLKTTFVAWMNTLKSFGLDIVLMAHMDEQKDGDGKIERIDIQGGSKNEVYKVSDLMGRFYMENRKRVLNFSPSDVAFGKNPAQLDPFDVPHYSTMPGFLGGIIKTTKDAINKLSAEQQEVQLLLADWQTKVGGAATAADFNALMPAANEIDARIRDNAKRILIKVARDKEILFDAKAKAFVAKEVKPENPKAESPSSGSSSASPPANGKAEPKPEAPKAEAPTTEREPVADDGDEKGDAPTAAELEAAGQQVLPTATKKKGKAA